MVARDAPRVFLLLEDGAHEARREGDVYEATVDGVQPGDRYAWAVDPARPLFDPSAVAVDRSHRLPCLVADPPPPIAWRRPAHARADQLLYELHVRGFTRHPSSGVAHPGTFVGVAERVDHLVELGITTVELMPVHEFDEREGRGNYWGYSPIAWCAPNRRYAAADPIAEFRAMVQSLHAAGIEVIVDVVFNHTAELGRDGPVLHWKALEARHAYERKDRSGCGNSVDTGEPRMRRAILDCLRWWHHGLGADGFRFDLATILSRKLVREIETDPALRDAHLIAEPWDAAGGHLVEGWPGGARWSVWNDRYRDEVRGCWLSGSPGAAVLATRLSGNSDQFRLGPARSLNFVTAHDGFTLRDVVSYDRKHNEANGEDNRDGRDHEPSANHGAEGPTTDRDVRAARDRSRRNLLATLLLSQGVPMLLAGDEWGRTQLGNNNPYPHDSEEFWLDWNDRDRDPAFLRFSRGLIALRRATPALRRTTFLAKRDVTWLAARGGPPDWSDDAFAYRLHGDGELLVAVNLGDEPRRFTLPADATWHPVVDTGAKPPGDWRPDADPLPAPETIVPARALAVFRPAPRGREAGPLQPPTSNLQPPTSNLQPPTSNLQPPTSNLEPPTPMSSTSTPVTTRHFEYIAARCRPEDEFLAGLRRDAEAAGIPPIQIAPEEAAFLQVLLRGCAAREVVEVGTLAGYSAIAMARALPEGGRVRTIEFDPKHARFARDAVARSDVAGRVEVFEGAGMEVLPRFDANSADVAFLDADKASYGAYLEESLRIVRPGGLVLVDNAFAFGQLFDEHPTDPEAPAVQAFNEIMANESRLESIILPIGDGLWVGVVTGEGS